MGLSVKGNPIRCVWYSLVVNIVCVVTVVAVEGVVPTIAHVEIYGVGNICFQECIDKIGVRYGILAVDDAKFAFQLTKRTVLVL